MLFSVFFIEVMVDNAEEVTVEQAYTRLKCDPSITVAGLENALEAFFTAVGYRSIQEVIGVIEELKVTRKSSPQAVWLEI